MTSHSRRCFESATYPGRNGAGGTRSGVEFRMIRADRIIAGVKPLRSAAARHRAVVERVGEAQARGGPE
jgi:hypothetical protein